MKADFFYECERCKMKIPATFARPHPVGMQAIVTPKGPGTETTFRCEDCKDKPRTA